MTPGANFPIKVNVYFGMCGWITAFSSVHIALLMPLSFISYKNFVFYNILIVFFSVVKPLAT